MYALRSAGKILLENSWELCQAGFAVYMIILSVMDIRWRKLHFAFLLSGGGLAVLGCLCERAEPGMLLAAGGAVGIIFLVISKVTKESLGYGDSILILILGVFIGFWNLLYLLLTAFFLAAVFSSIMMLKNRFSRKTAFPFVPFLTAAYIGGMIIAGY